MHPDWAPRINLDNYGKHRNKDLDKCFTLKGSFSIRGAELQHPAFVFKQQQLHPIQLEQTRNLANVLIHVERVIGLLKNKFIYSSKDISLQFGI